MAEAAKTMQLIMSNPTEREMIRMRQDARRDEVTQIAAAERRGLEQGIRDSDSRMTADGVDAVLISKYTGLTTDQISEL